MLLIPWKLRTNWELKFAAFGAFTKLWSAMTFPAVPEFDRVTETYRRIRNTFDIF